MMDVLYQLELGLNYLNKNQITDKHSIALLKMYADNAVLIAQALVMLKNASLLTDYNREFVAQKNGLFADKLAFGLIQLNLANILERKNRKVLNDYYADKISIELIKLHQAGLLNDFTRKLVCEYIRFTQVSIVDILILIYMAGAWEKELLFGLKFNDANEARNVYQALLELQTNKILGKETCCAILNAKNFDPVSLSQAFVKLFTSNLYQWENFSLITHINAIFAWEVSDLLIRLEKANLLNDETRAYLILASKTSFLIYGAPQTQAALVTVLESPFFNSENDQDTRMKLCAAALSSPLEVHSLLSCLMSFNSRGLLDKNIFNLVTSFVFKYPKEQRTLPFQYLSLLQLETMQNSADLLAQIIQIDNRLRGYRNNALFQPREMQIEQGFANDLSPHGSREAVVGRRGVG